MLLEHCRPGRLRPREDVGHRLVRQGDAGPAQGQQELLRHEDPRQAESERESHSEAVFVFSVTCTKILSFNWWQMDCKEGTS